jgi:hypothetical protein
MAVIEAVLAVIGLVLLILLTIGVLSGRASTPPPTEEDLAASYREGLHAAVRMQTTAQDLQQRLYAEAIRHAKDDRGGSA